MDIEPTYYSKFKKELESPEEWNRRLSITLERAEKAYLKKINKTDIQFLEQINNIKVESLA